MAENREQIIRTEYSEIMQKSYIDYAMSVIIARALPDVRFRYMECMNALIKSKRGTARYAVFS